MTNKISLSLGAVSNSDVGGHGSPLFPVSCSFDDLDFTDFQQLAEAFHEVQPWSSSASLALNFPSDYDVLKSMLSHDMYKIRYKTLNTHRYIKREGT